MSSESRSEITLNESVYKSFFQCRQVRRIVFWRTIRQFFEAFLVFLLLTALMTCTSPLRIPLYKQLAAVGALSLIPIIRCRYHTLTLSETQLTVQYGMSPLFEFSLSGPHVGFIAIYTLDSRWHSVILQISDPNTNPVPESRNLIRLIFSTKDVEILKDAIDALPQDSKKFLAFSASCQKSKEGCQVPKAVVHKDAPEF